MSTNGSILVGCGLAIIATGLYLLSTKKSLPAPLPPGPKGFPLLGNITDLPQSQPWVTYAEWGKKYGAITHVNALGMDIVVLNDSKYAFEMLEKKGHVYSDRPTLTMAGELVGWDQGPTLLPFGDKWSKYRQVYAQFLGARSKLGTFEPVLQEKIRSFLRRVLDDSSNWVEHGRRYAGDVVLGVAYGYRNVNNDDVLVEHVNKAMKQFFEITATGTFLVDLFPALRFVPGWFPGTTWKQKIPEYKDTLQKMLNSPYEWAKQKNKELKGSSSFVSELLNDKKGALTEEDEDLIKWAASGIYGGSADTTAAGLESFVLAMTLQPEAQRKAQEELDRVIGSGRLPTLADRINLPYVDAVHLEVMRNYILGPTGFPHVSSDDDIHDGYFIPKGSIIIPNVWQFYKDPKTYSNPEKFLPERFIATEDHAKEFDPRGYLFGFGRRICPGIDLGDASLWLLCVSLLHTFNVNPPVKNGQLVLPLEKYTNGAISHPEPFECVMKPRSNSMKSLIKSFRSNT